MITTASPNHFDGIRVLWKQAFGDDLNYINFFLKNGVQLQNILVYLQEDFVGGMLFIIPCQLVFENKSYKCAYFYSIATLEAYRGRGISTELLKYAHDLCVRRGYDVCTLVPATASLFEFYAQRGYAAQGYLKTYEVGADAIDPTSKQLSFFEMGIYDILELRHHFFGKGYLRWEQSEMDYIIRENDYLSGKFYGFDYNGSRGYLSCVPSANSIIIREFCGNNLLLPNITASLHSIYNKQNYLYRLSNLSNIGETKPFAMTNWISNGSRQPFYLSHVLD